MASIFPARGASGGDSSGFFWRAQVVGWLFLGVIGFCIRYAAFGNARMCLWLTLFLDTLAFLGTSLAALLHARLAGGSRRLPVLALAMLLCILGAALLAQLANVVHALFPADAVAYVPRNGFSLGFVYYLGIFSIWTLAYFGVSAELEARSERISKMKLETRALQMELEHLQRQVEPHFLFNSLNTILGEIAERPAIAEEMTRRLADYLRYSLSRRNHAVCRLEEELAAVENYVGIQALRFDDRFGYRCEVAPDALGAGIPHMALQGLVENAIKHGMRADDVQFRVSLRAWMEGGRLVVEVDNPGMLRPSFDASAGGVGLSNLRQRLALRYPDRHAFSLQQRGDRTVATLWLEGEPCFG